MAETPTPQSPDDPPRERHRGVRMTGADGADGPKAFVMVRPAHVQKVDVLFSKQVFAR